MWDGDTREIVEPTPTSWWVSILVMVVLFVSAIWYQAYQIQQDEIDHLRYRLNTCEMREMVRE